MQRDRAPHRVAYPAECCLPEPAVRVLQVVRVRRDEPEHEVGVRAKAAYVVGATDDDIFRRGLLEERLDLGGGLLARVTCDPGRFGTQPEHCVHGVADLLVQFTRSTGWHYSIIRETAARRRRGPTPRTPRSRRRHMPHRIPRAPECRPARA